MILLEVHYNMNELRHVGIIMDGNRRWAKRNKLKSVLNGHEMGTRRLIDACKWCKKYGIKYITVYAFSTENWNRSDYEVKGLFELMAKFFRDEIDNCISEGINIVVSGNRSMLDKKVVSLIENVEEDTSKCDKVFLNIGISYGGRDELLRAVRACCNDAINGTLLPSNIDESTFSEYLDTVNRPDIDLVIRTGGNHRLSGFFPWQTVYSEIFFTDILWPDFSEALFVDAIKYFDSIQINKGK